MLLAVEGGGFFSSSASGYSKGLALLLLGQQKEERPIRVSPWNQYQLVEQEAHPDYLASRKRASHGCTSFICFGCRSRRVDESSPPKVGPLRPSETLPDSSTSDQGKVMVNGSVNANDRKVCLKSRLRRPTTDCSVIVGEADGTSNSLEEVQNGISCCSDRRKIQWTDACGGELVEIREFEVSEGESDDELEGKRTRRCECVIQ